MSRIDYLKERYSGDVETSIFYNILKICQDLGDRMHVLEYMDKDHLFLKNKNNSYFDLICSKGIMTEVTHLYEKMGIEAISVRSLYHVINNKDLDLANYLMGLKPNLTHDFCKTSMATRSLNKAIHDVNIDVIIFLINMGVVVDNSIDKTTIDICLCNNSITDIVLNNIRNPSALADRLNETFNAFKDDGGRQKDFHDVNDLLHLQKLYDVFGDDIWKIQKCEWRNNNKTYKPIFLNREINPDIVDILFSKEIIDFTKVIDSCMPDSRDEYFDIIVLINEKPWPIVDKFLEIMTEEDVIEIYEKTKMTLYHFLINIWYPGGIERAFEISPLWHRSAPDTKGVPPLQSARGMYIKLKYYTRNDPRDRIKSKFIKFFDTPIVKNARTDN